MIPSPSFILKIITFIVTLKSILTNPKNPGSIFCSSLFQILKKHTCESKKTWRNFLLIPFSNAKKSILTNPKKPDATSLFISFSNIKKAYLQILKNLAQFFVYPFLKYYKT